MANLFDVSDFSLFTKYQGKTQSQEPSGQAKLRGLYDKLGLILDELNKLGYNTQITRNPLIQGGPSMMKYSEYHWSKVYPKEQPHYLGCMGKVFVVVGTTEGGVNIHIDSNTRKGYDSDSNEVVKAIKEDTWLQIGPEEAATYTAYDFAKKIDEFYQENWIEFNKVGKEFGVQECIDILNKMDNQKITNLLLANHNIILTGAPGTGKTYLAKEIAKSMGAEWKLVQFHPSYDYTDFVEGLRPIKKGAALGFERKDGVFKKFCKDAIKSHNIDIDNAIAMFVTETEVDNNGQVSIPYYDTPTKGSFIVEKGTDTSFSIISTENPQSATIKSIKTVIETSKKVGNQTYSYCIAKYIVDNYLNKNSNPKVFIIDEINRGELSKIFGELFYSIDPGYRGESGIVETQYQNLIPKEGDVDFDPKTADVFRNGFYIPQNVYIIGTMNDIDRSVESMDFAIRRRFAWKEITAESRQSMLDDINAWNGNKPDQTIIDEIKIRMNNLNACIIDKYGEDELSQKDKVGLTTAYQIGASYFLKYRLYGNFDELWDNHLKGLLYEYLRGTTNIESKIERLHSAYNNTIAD